MKNTSNTQEKSLSEKTIETFLNCGKPANVLLNKTHEDLFCCAQSCKKTYLCAFCAQRFSNVFCSNAQQLADYSAENYLTLLFITLSYKPCAISDLAENIRTLKDHFNSLLRTRLSPDTIEREFTLAIYEYAQSLKKQIEKDEITFTNAANKIDLQHGFYQQLQAFLATLDNPRFSHVFEKAMVRLEIKVREDGSVFPHLHLLCAVNAPIPQPLLSRLFAKQSGSGVVDIQLIKPHEATNVSRYIAKYMSKTENGISLALESQDRHSQVDRLRSSVEFQIQCAIFGVKQVWRFGCDKTQLTKRKTANVYVATVKNAPQTLQLCDSLFAQNRYTGDKFAFAAASDEKLTCFITKKSVKFANKETIYKKIPSTCDVTETPGHWIIWRRTGIWDLLCLQEQIETLRKIVKL